LEGEFESGSNDLHACAVSVLAEELQDLPQHGATQSNELLTRRYDRQESQLDEPLIDGLGKRHSRLSLLQLVELFDNLQQRDTLTQREVQNH
jgi:hypothetical protein